MNMDWKTIILQTAAKPGDGMVFSLSSPKGGEGWGEEAVLISRPSPRPFRSFLTGRGRVFPRHSVSIRGLIE